MLAIADGCESINRGGQESAESAGANARLSGADCAILVTLPNITAQAGWRVATAAKSVSNGAMVFAGIAGTNLIKRL